MFNFWINHSGIRNVFLSKCFISIFINKGSWCSWLIISIFLESAEAVEVKILVAEERAIEVEKKHYEVEIHIVEVEEAF